MHLLCSPKHADMPGIKPYCFGSGDKISNATKEAPESEHCLKMLLANLYAFLMVYSTL